MLFFLSETVCVCVSWINSCCFCRVVDCKRKRKCLHERKLLLFFPFFLFFLLICAPEPVCVCVRGSPWPDMNIMDSAMWDKRRWLITSPGRCPFLYTPLDCKELSASVSSLPVQSPRNYSFCGADGEVRAREFIRLGRQSFDHMSPLLTGIWSSSADKRNPWQRLRSTGQTSFINSHTIQLPCHLVLNAN